ncbi:MAG: hypothetical protein COB33_004685 [Thiotrichaceae bacterium]|nr:hypothetical protein [Thiotrichaceae bacterium]PCI14980.1 MAG: hypothetical protein COB71_00045 [Thiotrichales bacterium]
MYYFENDPLQSVYDDLYGGRTPTHFDQVMRLKGKAKDAFEDAPEDCYCKRPNKRDHLSTQRKHRISGPRPGF